jgi:hypothetical protein
MFFTDAVNYGHYTASACPERQVSNTQRRDAISQADGRLTAPLQNLKNWRILKETGLFPQ